MICRLVFSPLQPGGDLGLGKRLFQEGVIFTYGSDLRVPWNRLVSLHYLQHVIGANGTL